MNNSFNNKFSVKVNRRDSVRNANFEEKIINVGRVTKVVTGGRVFSFSALVVIGNKQGYFGLGLGKALEVSGAKRKAINSAKNNLMSICLTKTGSIPHMVKGKYGATEVLLMPAMPGTGIISAATPRAIFECVGIKNITAKILGSRNPHNVSKAIADALMQLSSLSYLSRNFRKKSLKFNTNKAQKSDIQSQEAGRTVDKPTPAAENAEK